MIKDILDYKEPVTKIYFVRHGQTNANKLKLLFGKLDWDLNKQGLKDARNAAKKLTKVIKKEKIDFIISSPLKRARHTAKIIAKELKIKKIIIDNNLAEKSEGQWEGKSFWEVKEKDSKNYYKWVRDPFRNRPPQGESTLDLSKRVKKFHKIVLQKYLGKNIIVIAHSGPIRLFILNLLQVKINKFWYLKLECGAISEVHISRKHSMVWSFNTIL